MSCLERSFGAVFCFPTSLGEIGEAWGKQQDEGRSGRTAALGLFLASGVPKPAAPSSGAGPPASSPLHWARPLPEVAMASWACLPGCFPNFLSEGTKVIVQLLHRPD